MTFVDSPERDAARRDFTVNAIYRDLDDGRLLDPCGGLADLAARTLRTVGDPEVRLREDPLRLLRAVRFAARCELAPAAGLTAAIAAAAGDLRALASERVFAELSDAFTGHRRGAALRLLVDWGLAAVVLPEVAATDGCRSRPSSIPRATC